MKTGEQPYIHVGIQSNPVILFRLNGIYRLKESGKLYEGEYRVMPVGEKIRLEGDDYSELTFIPVYYDTATFDLYNVHIGIDFHWEREENQRFKGALHIIYGQQDLIAINEVLLEDYLLSVISSEMNATSSMELLKAHAVISRSWLITQLNGKGKKENRASCLVTDNEIIRWYDREDHTLFDVCADDHCQRYQGVTRVSTPAVQDAIEQTFGEVLVYDGEVCDARFSKCCGGITEGYETCWEDSKHYGYLESVRCWNGDDVDVNDKNLFSSWENWITDSPPAFCNTDNKEVLAQILNTYDCETPDFFRWEVSYSQAELSALIQKKTGIDFGSIVDLIPEERGWSGRISKLHIIGSKRDLHIGKELEIRKALSETHLYSSAFIVSKENVKDGIPGNFFFNGAGWGHGVGLCQIGAAIMAADGHHYSDILHHYFKNASLRRLYHL